MRALVAINGECSAATLSRVEIDQFDILVAVDGGVRHLQKLNATPDWLIGDMDSIESSALEELTNTTTQLIRHPVQKDATDLELTLQHLQNLHLAEVTLLGMAGGRFDHVLVNVLLLGLPSWRFKINFFMPQGFGSIITAAHPYEMNLEPQTELSLVPLTAQVSGVSCSGLYYPLQNAEISLGSSLGLSNVVVDTVVKVSVDEGKLLLLHNSEPCSK